LYRLAGSSEANKAAIRAANGRGRAILLLPGFLF
jgi:hypothetical protein